MIKSIILIFVLSLLSGTCLAFISPLSEVISPQNQEKIKKWKEEHAQGQSLSFPEDFPRDIDLRYRDTPIKEQWNGTCSTFALLAGIENLINEKINSKELDLSERHLWSMYKRYDCELAINRALEPSSYISTEEFWPQYKYFPYSGYLNKENAHARLLKASSLLSDIKASILKLKDGKPLFLAMSVTKDLMNCQSNITGTSETTGGGHALSIVGYHLDQNLPGSGYFIVKNSWGKDCGDKGYQYLSFSQCLREDMYCEIWSLDEVEY